MEVFVPGIHIGKKASTFVWIYIMSVGGDGTAPYLKTLEKFVLPANKNFTTFFKKHVYELWQSLFQASILKKGKYSCLDLHYAHKVETGQSYI